MRQRRLMVGQLLFLAERCEAEQAVVEIGGEARKDLVDALADLFLQANALHTNGAHRGGGDDSKGNP